jgi:23S rRNA (pseudouridine1915-N3)-methyltransferase
LKLRIFAVGHKPRAWIAAGFDEYAKRMPREARIELIEIKPSARPDRAPVEPLLAAEKTRILAAIPAGSVKIALDERGQALSTGDLARRLGGWMEQGRDAAFLIGSADGLDASLKNEADLLLSLSAMTLPHALVRVMLAEQLYRAISLLRNHPYHRD